VITDLQSETVTDCLLYLPKATEGYRRLPKAAEGYRMLPKADVVRRRQGQIQGGSLVSDKPLPLRNTEALQKKFNDVLGRLSADIVDTNN